MSTGSLDGTTPNPPVPNRTDINCHLYALFYPAFVQAYPDALIEIAWTNSNGDPNRAKLFSAFTPELAADFAEQQNLDGHSVYVGAALRKGGTTGRAKIEDILAGSHAWCEFDDEGDLARVDRILQQHGLPPSHTVVTGCVPHPRFQHFFLLDRGAAPDQLRAVNEALHELLGGDPVHSPHMLMRLAGTVNYPAPKKLPRGRVVELTSLKWQNKAPVYAIERLAGVNARPTGPYLVAKNGMIRKPPASANGGGRTGAGNGADAGNVGRKPGRSDDEVLALLEAGREPGKWHNNVRNAIATMLGRGWPDSAIKMACKPYFIDGFTDADFADLIDGARIKWSKQGSRTPIVRHLCRGCDRDHRRAA
jgi:hypothetical protein